MTAKENNGLQSPASSSTWSGPSSGGRSIQTFNSETASDPMWREPVERLRWWKYRVALAMSVLREQGKEGMDVIKRQELRARGRFTDLLMDDGSQLPDDLSFWKARHDYFAQAWRQIQAKNGVSYTPTLIGQAPLRTLLAKNSHLNCQQRLSFKAQVQRNDLATRATEQAKATLHHRNGQSETVLTRPRREAKLYHPNEPRKEIPGKPKNQSPSLKIVYVAGSRPETKRV
ncbi:hypothetical protein MY11210_006788 [Beauveria gryllotalpidicola]